MKALLIITFCIVALHNCYSQMHLTADGLLNLIKSRGGVFEVIEKANINRGGYETILDDSLQSVYYFNDYENAYHNQKLKEELLRLLNDMASYARLYSEDRIYKIYTLNTEYTRNKVSNWLTIYRGQEKDTIMKTKSLFNQYKDSLIMAESKKYYNEALHNFEISKYTKELLTRLKYPEVYVVFYKKWEQDGKTFDSEWFKYLLDFQDPEAEKLYDDYIDNALLGKRKEDIIEFKNYICHTYNDYAISRFIKMLDKSDLVEVDYLTYKIPIYILLLSEIENIYMYYLLFKDETLANSYYNIEEYAFSGQIEKAITEYNKIKTNLIACFKRMLKYNGYTEIYWKQNMPYYKKE